MLRRGGRRRELCLLKRSIFEAATEILRARDQAHEGREARRRSGHQACGFAPSVRVHAAAGQHNQRDPQQQPKQLTHGLAQTMVLLQLGNQVSQSHVNETAGRLLARGADVGVQQFHLRGSG